MDYLITKIRSQEVNISISIDFEHHSISLGCKESQFTACHSGKL